MCFINILVQTIPRARKNAAKLTITEIYCIGAFKNTFTTNIMEMILDSKNVNAL